MALCPSVLAFTNKWHATFWFSLYAVTNYDMYDLDFMLMLYVDAFVFLIKTL